MTFIEEQLKRFDIHRGAAKVHPVLTVFKLKGHQYGYRGNVICFSQDVNDLTNQLPHRVGDLDSVIYVKVKNTNEKCHELRVRRESVRRALLWLKQHSEHHKNV